MKTITHQVIQFMIQERGRVRPHEIGKELELSQVMVHRHLARLIEEGQIVKIGKAPLVFMHRKSK
ncbi:MAG: HTH domain-containing protein [Patescibacteria group bacterium]